MAMAEIRDQAVARYSQQVTIPRSPSVIVVDLTDEPEEEPYFKFQQPKGNFSGNEILEVDLAESPVKRKDEAYYQTPRNGSQEICITLESDSEDDTCHRKFTQRRVFGGKRNRGSGSYRQTRLTFPCRRVKTGKVHTSTLKVQNHPLASSKAVQKVEHQTSVETGKTFSNYDSAISKRGSRPVLDNDHAKYKSKFHLKPLSVVAVDLCEFPLLVHSPDQHSTNSQVVSLQSVPKDVWANFEIQEKTLRVNRETKKLNAETSGNGMHKRGKCVPLKTSTGPLPRKKARIPISPKDTLIQSQTDKGNLKDIVAANVASRKPKVELIAPTGSNLPPAKTPEPPDPRISKYPYVFNKVLKLLSSSKVLYYPAMHNGDGISEDRYSAKKIAWWFLKNEQEPAMEGVYHPELHDYDEEEAHSDDFDWPDDDDSLDGSASDPEGLAAAAAGHRSPEMENKDPKRDKEESILSAKVRKTFKVDPDPSSWNTKKELQKKIKIFFFDYFTIEEKPKKKKVAIASTCDSVPEFKAKCNICNEEIMGEQILALEAHIYSENHQNNFRNYSLQMANYAERLYKPHPRKQFAAKLGNANSLPFITPTELANGWCLRK